MGTAFRYVLCTGDTAGVASAVADAHALVLEIEHVFSDYDPSSEVSRLAALGAGRHPVSPELAHVLTASLAWTDSSGGAFDVTLGSLTRMWRRAMRRGEIPATEAVDSARRQSGARFLELIGGDSVDVAIDGLRLDFGGIAKGHAADRARELLAARGFPVTLVDAGGDLSIGDAPTGSGGWSVAVDHGNGASQAWLLQNTSVATSGDRYQFVDSGGVRYSHILDPATGLGTTVRRTVTVVAPDGADADALASALSVMDLDAGLSMAGRYGRAVLVATPDTLRRAGSPMRVSAARPACPGTALTI
jgi:thiamine biosynthesis lipoprotein